MSNSNIEGSAESLSTSLAKLRRLTSSALPHQSKPAQLLEAIESTLSSTIASTSSSTTPSSTAYFIALLQCLEKACADELPDGGDDDMAETENMGQGALIPATLYILALVVPETPAKVVQSKLETLMDLVLGLYDTALPHPPALRSLLQITTSVILACSGPQLNSSPLLKKGWAYLLELGLDHRPKVRHLAQEGVRKVLTTAVPPRSTAGGHPYISRAREWVLTAFAREGKAGGGKGKKARFDEDDESKKVIWVVQGLRGWVAVWGDDVSCLGNFLVAKLILYYSTYHDCAIPSWDYPRCRTSHNKSTTSSPSYSGHHLMVLPQLPPYPVYQPSWTHY